MRTIDLWPGDRVKWRKVEFTINSTKKIIYNVAASELEAI